MESESQHVIKVEDCVGDSQLTHLRQTPQVQYCVVRVLCVSFSLLPLLCLPLVVLCYLCQVLTIQGCTVLPAYVI